jgi:NADPH:quinone reductase-like Zn-dependent oxidoreductase
MAKERGATVISTATPAQAAFIADLGADETVDFTGDLAAAIRSSRPAGVDVVLHFAGDGVALANLLKPGGRLASTLGVSTQQLKRQDVTAKPIMTIPSPTMLGELASAAASGELRVPITRTYGLDQVGQALKDFGAGALGKLAITVR